MNPEKFYRVSQTQLSIARYYGGCNYNGDSYIYDPTDDSLIRSDIFKKNKKVSRELSKLAKHQWDDIDSAKDLFK